LIKSKTIVKKIQLSGQGGCTTNNIMELSAPLEALLYIEKEFNNSVFMIDIITDSQYVQKGITEWITNWKRNGWKTANNKPVSNKELWIKLDAIYSRKKVNWIWTRGFLHNYEM
jgi:ribonuclease HI